MGLVYRFDVSKGPGPLFSGHVVYADQFRHFAPTAPHFATDANYPDIIHVEEVKVTVGGGDAGQNIAETDLSEAGNSETFAGISLYKKLALERFTIVARWRLTQSAIDDGLPFAPLFHLNNGSLAQGEFLLAAFLDGGNIGYELDYYLSGVGVDQQSLSSYSRPVAGVSRDVFETFVVRGRNGAWQNSASGARSQDGYLNFSINGATVYDVQNIDLDIARGAFGISGGGALEQQLGVMSYHGIGFDGFYGQFDYLEIYDDDGQSVPCCASASVGSTGSGGGGSDTPAPPTVSDNTPIVSPGGVVTPVGPRNPVTWGPRSYTPIVGGGVLVASTDPTDPQGTDAMTDPIRHIELVPADNVTRVWGKEEINAGVTSSPIVQKVVSHSEIYSEVMANRRGTLPSPGWTVQVDDKDHLIKGWAAGSNRYLLNRFASFLVEEYGQRVVDTLARKITAGFMSGWDYVQDEIVELQFADLFSATRSPMSLTKKIPRRIFSKNMNPQAPEGVWGRPVPIWYGEMSDDYNWFLDSSFQPVGLVPGIPIGPVTSLKILNQKAPLGSYWNVFVHAGHPLAKVTSCFAVTGSGQRDDPTGRYRFAPDYHVIVDSMTQEQQSGGVDWNYYFDGKYLRVQGADGTIEDYGATLLLGPKSASALDGTQPYAINGWGIEDVGDGTGLLIDSAAHQLAHFLCYWVFGDHRYGPWGPLPAFPDGTPKFNRASVSVTKAVHDAMLSGGRVTSMFFGKDVSDIIPATQRAADLQISTGIQLGWDHFGAMFEHTFNPLQATSGLVTFDQTSITQFTVKPNIDFFGNFVQFDYGPEPSTGRISGLLQTLIDATSVSGWGEQRDLPKFTNIACRILSVALNVGGWMLTRCANVPTIGTFVTDERGLGVKAGQSIRLTSEFGLGTTGWTDRIVEVTAIVQLDSDNTRIEWEDVHDLLEATTAQQSIFTPSGLSTGRYWGQPVGLNSNGTSMPLGLNSNGTARPLL